MKLKGLGEVEYLSTYRKDEGVMDYEEEFSSEMEKDGDEAVWSLTLFRVTKSMGGFYQCEVRVALLFPATGGGDAHGAIFWRE